MSEWISVKDGMPKSGKRVLFSFFNCLGNQRTGAGMWCSKHTVEAGPEDECCDYCEDEDTYYLTEGWIEYGHETEYSAYVSNVTHWMPLPEPPKVS